MGLIRSREATRKSTPVPETKGPTCFYCSGLIGNEHWKEIHGKPYHLSCAHISTWSSAASVVRPAPQETPDKYYICTWLRRLGAYETTKIQTCKAGIEQLSTALDFYNHLKQEWDWLRLGRDPKTDRYYIEMGKA